MTLLYQLQQLQVVSPSPIFMSIVHYIAQVASLHMISI